jgi:hypothetical protein
MGHVIAAPEERRRIDSTFEAAAKRAAASGRDEGQHPPHQPLFWEQNASQLQMMREECKHSFQHQTNAHHQEHGSTSFPGWPAILQVISVIPLLQISCMP